MYPIDEDKVDEHRKELCKVLRYVIDDARGERQLKRFPTNLSQKVLTKLRDRNEKGCGEIVRHIHDFYGWMARSGARRAFRGHCAGALYRTVKYLKIPRADRNGTQGIGRNIHIEHTVQVEKVLVAALKANIGRFHTAYALHRFLLDRSVCTAFSEEEEVWLREAERGNPHYVAFNGEELKNIYPFSRYLPLAEKHGSEFRIVNVVTSKEICLNEFSLADHVASLEQVSKMVAANCRSLYDLELFDKPQPET